MYLHEALFARLETQHLAVPEIIKGLAEEQTLLMADGKWSIHQNIAHLARYQQVFTNRIEAIIAANGLIFYRYVASEDEQFDFFVDSTTINNIDHINRHRADILNLLRHLGPDKLDHFATHPKFGQMNVPQWVEFFLLHEAHHIYTIFQLAQAIRQR